MRTPPKSLLETHPEVALLADGWNPANVSYGSRRKMRWKCEKGHTWYAEVRSLALGFRCRICSGRELLTGVNDLQTLYPEIAAEADGWDPKLVLAGSTKKLNWKCSVGHKWIAKVSSRSYENHGCLFCNKSNLSIGNTRKRNRESIDITDPDISWMLTSENPKNLTRGSRKVVEWKCKYQHHFKQRVQDFVKNKKCPVCSGTKILSGVNDLKTLFPEVASEAYGWNPSLIGAHVNKFLDWKCVNGHVYKAQISDRTRQRSNSGKGANCPYCSGKRVLSGFNDLATTHKQLASELLSEDPTKFTAGSERRVKWRCPEGHIYEQKIFSRKLGNGCPSCGKRGFDQTEEGWLYLLRHESWGMLQVGITNNPSQRLASHRKLGWSQVDLRGPMDGLLTRKIESDIINFLIANNAKVGDTKIAGKFDGYSESWIEETYPVNTLRDLIEKIM